MTEKQFHDFFITKLHADRIAEGTDERKRSRTSRPGDFGLMSKQESLNFVNIWGIFHYFFFSVTMMTPFSPHRQILRCGLVFQDVDTFYLLGSYPSSPLFSSSCLHPKEGPELRAVAIVTLLMSLVKTLGETAVPATTTFGKRSAGFNLSVPVGFGQFVFDGKGWSIVSFDWFSVAELCHLLNLVDLWFLSMVLSFTVAASRSHLMVLNLTFWL